MLFDIFHLTFMFNIYVVTTMLITLAEDHLKRLTREIVTIKYDMKQVLNLLDILVEKSNKSTGTQECGNTKLSLEDAENRFPLQTVAQLAEVEDILKTKDSQHNAEIVRLCI